MFNRVVPLVRVPIAETSEVIAPAVANHTRGVVFCALTVIDCPHQSLM